jgi:hypothetical protein
MMATRTVWTGTASDLLDALARKTGDRVTKSRAWPESPRALADRLRRAAPFLRKLGIDIEFTKKGRARTRVIYIRTTPSSAPPECDGERSSASAFLASPSICAAKGAASVDTDPRADGRAGDSSKADTATVGANSSNISAGTAADGADANCLPQSGPEKSGA